MHSPLHIVFATEADRMRRAAVAEARMGASIRRRRGRSAAPGVPSRAAPGMDSPSIGRPFAAAPRGR